MEFEVSHDVKRVTALYDALWAERFGNVMRVAGVLAGGAMTWLLLGGGALAGVAFGAAVMVVVLAQVMRETVRRQVAAWLAEFGPTPLRYRIEDDSLHETSSQGECMLRWQAFAAARELQGFLVLPRRPSDAGQLIALPLATLPAAARLAIEDRIAAAAAGRVG